MGLIKTTLFGLFSSLIALPLVAQEATSGSGSEEINYNKLPEEYWPLSSQVKEKNQDQLEALEKAKPSAEAETFNHLMD